MRYRVFATIAAIAAVLLSGLRPARAQSEPVTTGAPAPDFTLPDQNGRSHTLAHYRGKIVAIAFYPADMTPGCTLEAHAYTNARAEFAKRGVVALSVSVQNVASKKKFCKAEGLKHALLADDGGKVAASYGVLGPGGMARRVTFLVDAAGVVTNVIDRVDVRNAAQQVLDLLPPKQEKVRRGR